MCGRLCGLCFRTYRNLQQHFQVSHTIENKEERMLLLKYGSARVDTPLTCPMCSKKSLARLDKHLIDVHNIQKTHKRQGLVTQAKRAYLINQLALLRSSDPDPPMVSTLDLQLDHSSDLEGSWMCPVEEDTLEEASSREGSEQRGVPSTSAGLSVPSPAGKCCGYNLIEKKFDALVARLEKLEEEVQHLHTTQQRSLRKTGSAQKGEKVLGELGETVYGKILLDFEEYRREGRTGSRVRDNAHLARSHVHRFIQFMKAGSKGMNFKNDLIFLNQISRVRLWPRYLSELGYQVSSIKSMLLNVVLFFRHVENCFLSESKLSMADIRNILYELKMIQIDMRSELVAHRQQVLRTKSENEAGAKRQTAQPAEKRKRARSPTPSTTSSEEEWSVPDDMTDYEESSLSEGELEMMKRRR